MAYLAENDCTNDVSLEATFANVKRYLANTTWKWIVSLIFLIAVFSLDAMQVLLHVCLTKQKKLRKEKKEETTTSSEEDYQQDDGYQRVNDE